MTPGQRALAEAARLETAKIYGALCPEHHATPATAQQPLEHGDAVVIDMRASGQSVASIAFRLGTTKRAVNDVLRRAGAA